MFTDAKGQCVTLRSVERPRKRSITRRSALSAANGPRSSSRQWRKLNRGVAMTAADMPGFLQPDPDVLDLQVDPDPRQPALPADAAVLDAARGCLLAADEPAVDRDRPGFEGAGEAEGTRYVPGCRRRRPGRSRVPLAMGSGPRPRSRSGVTVIDRAEDLLTGNARFGRYSVEDGGGDEVAAGQALGAGRRRGTRRASWRAVSLTWPVTLAYCASETTGPRSRSSRPGPTVSEEARAWEALDQGGRRSRSSTKSLGGGRSRPGRNCRRRRRLGPRPSGRDRRRRRPGRRSCRRARARPGSCVRRPWP